MVFRPAGSTESVCSRMVFRPAGARMMHTGAWMRAGAAIVPVAMLALFVAVTLVPLALTVGGPSIALAPTAALATVVVFLIVVARGKLQFESHLARNQRRDQVGQAGCVCVRRQAACRFARRLFRPTWQGIGHRGDGREREYKSHVSVSFALDRTEDAHGKGKSCAIVVTGAGAVMCDRSADLPKFGRGSS
ncbi:MAG: hypothetical protein B7Z73_03850 [Planctomycetia bacterium 21-64-5]|nr:MAG: hypothetical protein B7Z73_03850 [Planctomycetia bacterium 21-64-5]